VTAVEETAETIYLVLPGRSADVQAGELSDRELEAVGGGSTWDDDTCHSCPLVILSLVADGNR
jgi:hypothetical protein